MRVQRPSRRPRHVVALPVRNEADRIGRCLLALARQQGHRPDLIVLLLNGCTDGTEAAIDAIRPSLEVPVEVIAAELPPDQAHAGLARRLAMEHGALRASADGVLFTSDADAEVEPGWFAANLVALHDGADLVCGRAIIDPVEALAIPRRLHDDDADECAFDRLLDEIHARLDPDPADPWPRHTEHSGASLAVTVRAHRLAGGVPAVPLAEDRAYVAALRRIDARIRHAPDVRVVVSGRLDGRARGGMADTMRRRMAETDAFLDPRLEPAPDAARRASARARLRRLWLRRGVAPDLEPLADVLGLSPASLAAMLPARHFGAAWDAVEQASPALVRRAVAVADLPERMAEALHLCRQLRDAGTAPPASAQPATVPVPADPSMSIL